MEHVYVRLSSLNDRKIYNNNDNNNNYYYYYNFGELLSDHCTKVTDKSCRFEKHGL